MMEVLNKEPEAMPTTTTNTQDTPEVSSTDSTEDLQPDSAPASASGEGKMSAAAVEEAAVAAGKAVDLTIKAQTAPPPRPRPEQRYRVITAANELQLADLLNVEYQSLYKLCAGPAVAALPNGRVHYTCIVEKFSG